MNDMELEGLLHGALAPRALKQRAHSAPGACPPIPVIAAAAFSGRWPSAEERNHVRGCPICHRNIAMHWEVACPPDSLVKASLAPDSEWHEPVAAHARSCQPCRGVLWAERIKSWDPLAIFHRPEQAAVHAEASSGGTLCEGISGDGKLRVYFGKNEYGRWEATVVCPHVEAADAAQMVRLKIQSGGKEWTAELELKANGDVAEGIHEFADLPGFDEQRRLEVSAEWLPAS